MDLSVIIPHYNLPPALLARAIDSIVSQWPTDYESWEIIVVDDGSDLPPSTTVNSFQRDNVKLFCRDHARQGAARNFGLSQAHGQYILFLDADDYILPNTLPQLLSLAQHHDLDILRFQTVKTNAIDENDNLRPSTLDLRPQTSDLRPSTLDPRPSTSDLRPSTLDLRPSTSDLRPSTLDLRPSTLDLRPSTLDLTPTTGEEYLRRHNLPDSPSTFIFRRELAIANDVRFPEGVYLEDCMFTARLHHFAATLAEVDTKAYAYYQRSDSTVNAADAQHKELLRRHHLLAIDQLASFIQEQRGQRDTSGLQHKFDYLVVDYIRRICRDLPLKEIREQQLPLLRSRGLYPIPLHRNYGFKYQAFACLANARLGLPLLWLLSRR